MVRDKVGKMRKIEIKSAGGRSLYRVRADGKWIELWESGFAGWSRVFRPEDARKIGEALIRCADSIEDET